MESIINLVSVDLKTLDYNIFLYIGIILLATKFLGILTRKLGLPQVVGALIAGLLIGPILGLIVPNEENVAYAVLKSMAEIGVVMLMFSAGLETNVKEIKRNGVGNVVITMLGVIIPLGTGFLLSWAFTGFETLNSDNLLMHMFIGILTTATSVGITVECLKEMGKLKGKVGSSILSAAVLDDIIGIIILTVVIGVKSGESNVGKVFLDVFLFFIAAGVLGVIAHFIFKWLSKRYPVTRRLPIFGLAICFLFAWGAEKLFHVADITGAFIAGMIMSNMKATEYVERKIDINSYMMFSPIFFACIGIGITFSDFAGVSNWWIQIAFSLCFVIVAMGSKLLGCGIGAKVCGFSKKDSLRVGLGMMARGEVCLIMVQRGINAGILEPQIMIAVVMLVICSSLFTPILMKLTYKGEKPLPLDGALPGGQYNQPRMESPMDVTSQSFDKIIEMSENETLESIHQMSRKNKGDDNGDIVSGDNNTTEND